MTASPVNSDIKAMTIKEANLSQLDGITEIENSSFSDPWSKNSLREAIESDNITVFTVSDEDGRILAFSCLLIIEYEAEILNIAVSEKFRGRGIGYCLAGHMIDVCRARNVEDIFLEVRQSNIAARALYRKLGLCEIGIRKRYYANPTEDAVLMKMSLKQDDQN